MALGQALESSSARCAESAKSRTEIRAKALECVLDDGAASIVQSMAETLGDAFSQELKESWEACFERGRDQLRRDLDRADENPGSSPESALDAEAWDALAEAVRNTDVYRTEAGFRARFGDLEQAVAAAPGHVSLQEAATRIRLCAFSALEDANVRPAPNVMALAQRVLDLFFTPARSEKRSHGSGTHPDDPLDFDFSFGSDETPRDDFRLPASHLAKALKPLFGPESESIWQDVRRWETLARSGDGGEASEQYVSILATADGPPNQHTYEDGRAIAVLYKAVETRVGTNLYAHKRANRHRASSSSARYAGSGSSRTFSSSRSRDTPSSPTPSRWTWSSTCAT